jgi:hypothetical protein
MFNPGSVLCKFRVITRHVQETDIMILYFPVTHCLCNYHFKYVIALQTNKSGQEEEEGNDKSSHCKYCLNGFQILLTSTVKTGIICFRLYLFACRGFHK